MLLAFDWDGTLSDSVAHVIEANHILADKYQLPCPSDQTVKESIGRALVCLLYTSPSPRDS